MFRYLAGITVLAAAGLSAAQADARAFIHTSHMADTQQDNTIFVHNFFQRIFDASKNGDTLDLKGGGALASAATALKTIGSGAVDTGLVVYNYSPSELPALAFLGDLYGTDARVSAAATTETSLLNCPQCLEEMKTQNVYFPNTVSTVSYAFLCTSDFIDSVDALKGKKVRATGSMGTLATGLGATTVNLTMSEVFQSMQTGAVDCTMNDTGILKGAQLWEVAKAVTWAPIGTFKSLAGVAVNYDVWNDFTPQERRIWLDSSAVSLADYSRMGIDLPLGIEEEAATKHGVKFMKAPQPVVDAILNFRRTSLPALVTQARDRGVKDPEGIAQSYDDSAQKWAKLVDEIGTGPWGDAEWQAFATKVKTEIYDKISVD